MLPKPAKRSRPIRPCPQPSSEHVYRTIHGVDVPLRIWPSLKPGKRPWVFWIHGGGIMLGHHSLPNPWVLPALRSEGYHIVSVAYRLLPHASFSDALSDLQAAYTWCRSNLSPSLLALSPDSQVDLDAYITAGESAGGIMALLTPFHFTPPPRAVFEAYAITDLWEYHPPKAAYFPSSGKFAEEEIRRALEERDPRLARTGTPYLNELGPPWGRTDPKVLEAAIGRRLRQEEERDAALRNDMSNYCLKTKLTLPLLFRHTPVDKPGLEETDMVSGADSVEGRSQANDEFRRPVESLSPIHLLRKKGSYPPTAIWHGTRDGGVPHFTHALPFLRQLDALGVDSIALFAVDASHVFDAFIQEPSDQAWTDYVLPTLEFLRKHVPADAPEVGERERAKL